MPKNRGGALSIFAVTPLNVFINGNVAVQYFFALSGFLLARSLFRRENRYSLNFMLFEIKKRYLRLLPMIAGATIFVFLLMKFGLLHHLEVAGLVKNKDFLWSYNNFEPTFISLLYNIFIKTFFVANSYVGPFWTIKYEFIGFIVCLFLISVFGKSKWRRVLYLFSGGILVIFSKITGINIWSFGACSFMNGMLLADLLWYREADTTMFSKFYSNLIQKRWLMAVFFIIGLYLTCMTQKFYGIYNFPGIMQLFSGAFWRGIGVVLLMYVLYYSPKMQKVLETGIFQRLGSISFALYAFHWPVMLSLQAWIFGKLIAHYGYDFAALASFGISFFCILGVAYLAHIVIEGKDFRIKLKERFYQAL